MRLLKIMMANWQALTLSIKTLAQPIFLHCPWVFYLPTVSTYTAAYLAVNHHWKSVMAPRRDAVG